MKNIAVVGAGITGICTSFFLQKSGHKVTLIDHKEPGSITSYGHACTFADYACVPINSPKIIKNLPNLMLKSNSPLSFKITYLINNLPWAIKFLKNCNKDKVEYVASSLMNLLNNARLEYDNIFKEVDVKQYIKNNEVMYLYNTEKDYIADEFSRELRKKNGVKFKELNKNEIREIEPNVEPIYFSGILFEGSRYTINPKKISDKIFQIFIERGGYFLNKKVTSIEQAEKKVNIKCDNALFNFDEIVISAGAWSRKLALMVGDNFPLDTERGYHVLFDNNEKLISRPIGWSKSGFYIVQMDEGIRSAGTVEIAGLKAPPNPKRLKMIEQESRKLLPSLGKIKSTWLGFRPTLPDSMPVIGKSTRNKNIFYAFGHQHIGWTLGAVTGKVLQYLLQDKMPNYDISSFSPKRFK